MAWKSVRDETLEAIKEDVQEGREDEAVAKLENIIENYP